MHLAFFARWARSAALLLPLTLAACGGGGSDDSGSGGGGGTTPTTITLAVAPSSIDAGGSSSLTATLAGPGASSGVTWSLAAGNGSLSNTTTTATTYVAPANVTGAESVVIVARSIADTSVSATAQLIVSGTPVIVTPTLYPAYQNVAFGAQFGVAGGTSPYTWAITSGALPAGLALATSTSASNQVSGTPTAQGIFTFTVQATDNIGRAVSANVTLEVRAQTACLLLGNYAFVFAGFRGSDFIARGGSLSVAPDGKITGVEDFADVASNSLGSNLTNGTCRTGSQNYGNAEIASAAGTAGYTYAAIGNLTAAHIHQSDNSTARGSGELTLRTTPVTTAPSGSFAFGLFGVDTNGDGQGIVGRATLDAAGVITAGRVDVVGPGAQTGATLTGSFGAPGDAGRGTATLNFAGRTVTVYFYPVSADRFYALSAGSGGSRLAGFVTRQTPVATTVAGALANAGILSAWGMPLGAERLTVLGRLSAAGAANAQLVLDTARRGDAPRSDTLASMTASVEADGRAVFTSSDNARRFVVYFDGPGSGYAAETTGTAKYGLLEPQAAGPFSASQGGTFVSSTQFGNRDTTLMLAPQVTLNQGGISGAVTGGYAFDVTTGRGTGTASNDYYGGTGLVLYIVNGNRLRIMGNAQRGLTPVGSAISVLQR